VSAAAAVAAPRRAKFGTEGSSQARVRRSVQTANTNAQIESLESMWKRIP
jgi:hypothetical protein